MLASHARKNMLNNINILYKEIHEEKLKQGQYHKSIFYIEHFQTLYNMHKISNVCTLSHEWSDCYTVKKSQSSEGTTVQS